MTLTPHKLVQALRVAAVLAGVAATFALTGPIHYEDLGLPFPDTVAHAALFYALSVLMLAALPRSRAVDLAVALVIIGGLSEVVQGIVGRDMDWRDWLADSVGVGCAFVPVVASQFRALARRWPHAALDELKRMDRRAPRAAASARTRAAARER
jgi:VanZ family protein